MRHKHILLRSRARLRGERGFSMVEVMVAIFVFAVVMAGLFPVFGAALRVSGGNRYRSVAANLASREMDTVRGTKFTNLPVGLTTTTQVVDGVTYTIDRESEWITQNATAGPCGGGASGSSLAFLRVTVTVDWPNRGGIPVVRSQTLVSPPVGVYNTNTGNIAALVVDRNGAPQEGQLVTLTGPQGATEVTPSDGCALFAFLPAGTYTVSLSTVGFVDQQGNPAPSQTAAVSVGTTTSIQFAYDLASTLVLTHNGNAGGTPPNNAPVSLANTTLLPSGTKFFAGSGNPRTITGLFPFTAGYSEWSGSCADADPQGKNGSGIAFWPGATRVTPVTVTPGGATADTIDMGTLTVTVMKGATPQSGVGITAVHSPTSGDPKCPAGETLTYTGVTNASGVFTAAIPWGYWTIQVNGRSPVGPWPTKAMDPRIAGAQSITVQVT